MAAPHDRSTLTDGYGDGGRRTPEQLPEVVARYVREQILWGEFRPGEFLRLERIADAVGVSNTPVREGLLALRSEGCVELVPRRGFVVAPLTAQDVRDICWMQAQIAAELTARAATTLTPEMLETLTGIVDEDDAAIAADSPEAIADVGHAFHREINLAAGSPRLVLTFRGVARQLPRRLYASIESQLASAAHRQLLRALKKGDAAKASSLMEKHVIEGGEHLIELLAERGRWSDTETAR